MMINSLYKKQVAGLTEKSKVENYIIKRRLKEIEDLRAQQSERGWMHWQHYLIKS
jgi:hypothetical protein